MIFEVKIPNAEKAVIDVAKLRDYCLNPRHEVGKHKARLFQTLLGLTLNHVDVLYDALKQAVREQEAEPERHDVYGQRFHVIFEMTWQDKSAFVRSVWIIRSGEDFPRLVTCIPLKGVNV